MTSQTENIFPQYGCGAYDEAHGHRSAAGRAKRSIGQGSRPHRSGCHAELQCPIGGNLSTNAGGLCCVKYGVSTDAVLGLEAVARVVREGLVPSLMEIMDATSIKAAESYLNTDLGADGTSPASTVWAGSNEAGWNARSGPSVCGCTAGSSRPSTRTTCSTRVPCSRCDSGSENRNEPAQGESANPRGALAAGSALHSSASVEGGGGATGGQVFRQVPRLTQPSTRGIR